MIVAHTHRHFPPRPRRRRGSAYVLALGVAMIMTVIAMSSITLSRLNTRAVIMLNDTVEADALALAGIEHALTIIETSGTWRDDHTHDDPTTKVSLGRGTTQFKIVDESGDADLKTGALDPVRVHGIGAAGEARRSYSLLLADSGGSLEIVAGSYRQEVD